MNFSKLFWVFRGCVYRFFFGSFGFPSYIGKPVFISGCSKIFIDKLVRIFPGVRMEAHGEGSISIGSGSSIGQNFHVTSAGRLVIGKKVTILGNVFITNIDHDYTELDIHILEQKWIVKETVIGDNSLIGYGAAIQGGTILGKHCVVGANSVVRGEFPDYCVIVGAPARVVKRYNIETKKWERVDSGK